MLVKKYLYYLKKVILYIYMSSDLDLTFNTPNGFLTTTFNTPPAEPLSQDIAVSVLIRSDNRIVMGGYSQYTSGTYISLSCYNTDGSLYTAFGLGGTGKVLEAPTFSGSGFTVNDVILQPNDSIIVTGTFSYTIFVARFTSSGVLDFSGFGIGGYVIITAGTFGTQFDRCESNSVVLQSLPSNDYIVLGGSVRRIIPSTKTFLALVRLDAINGSLDTTSFGTSGTGGTVFAGFNILNEDFCNCLSIQTDGKIVSGGVNYSLFGSQLSVSRFNTNGTLDTTFNTLGATQGWLIIPNFFTSPNSSDFSSGLGINSVGQIIISGYITKQSGEQCFGVAAVTPTGILDTLFGTGGQTVLDLSPTYNLTGTAFSSGANALALQSDNKIVITGGFTNTITSAQGFSLARFDTNGTLDFTFGLAGLGYILSDLVSPNNEIGYSVAIQTDGKVLIGGTAIDSGDIGANNYFILARYFGFPPFPPPIVPICFPAGTPVKTDQGTIAIEKIDPVVNTIHNKPIVAITQSYMDEDTIVCIEKHALGINIPNKKTYISNYHGIVYNNKLIPAKQFVGRLNGVHNVNYDKQVLYNVLMEKHYIINVNNMKVETLNPKNIVAKLYTNEFSPEQKERIILEINETSKKNKIYRNYERLNGYENISHNKTRRKFSILRFNPLISRFNFQTKKYFISHNNMHNQTVRNRNPYVANIKVHSFKHSRRRR